MEGPKAVKMTIPGSYSGGDEDALRDRAFWVRTEATPGRRGLHPLPRPAARNPSPVLVVAVTAEQPSPLELRWLEHEYSLAAELDSAWAVKPLALTRHEGRTILVLKDP